MARQLDAAELARRAVVAVAADDPLDCDLLRRRSAVLDAGDDAVRPFLQSDQARRAQHLAALPVQVVGQDRLGHLFRDADVESVAAAAFREVDLAEYFAGGVQPRDLLLGAACEERRHDAERLEDLERARVHDRRAVPVHRLAMRVDQTARDAAAVQLRGQQQPRRARADHENAHVDRHRAITLAVRDEEAFGAVDDGRRRGPRRKAQQATRAFSAVTSFPRPRSTPHRHPRAPGTLSPGSLGPRRRTRPPSLRRAGVSRVS